MSYELALATLEGCAPSYRAAPRVNGLIGELLMLEESAADGWRSGSQMNPIEGSVWNWARTAGYLGTYVDKQYPARRE